MTQLLFLPNPLQVRLNAIVEIIPRFWEQGLYHYFTNHGPVHSQRVLQKVADLAQQLPAAKQLTYDETFVVSAAAWLYEIGIQSPMLTPILGFEYQPGDSLSFVQLQQIRAKKHLLSELLIRDAVRGDSHGHHLQLGLIPSEDDYTRAIATVCRWCSNEPLRKVPEILPVNGMAVRIRLLVALLRFADQLYIDKSRVNLALLQRADLPPKEFARWWVFHYTQTLPAVNAQIPFCYLLPVNQKEYLGHIRALIEPDFFIDHNPINHYIWDNGVHLIPCGTPNVNYDQPSSFLREMSPELCNYLQQNIIPLGESNTSILNFLGSEQPSGNIEVDTVGKELRKKRRKRRIIKILFLAANPSDTTRLKIEKESREIDQILRQAKFRNKFDIKYHFVVQIDDLQLYLLDYKPDIVHFSGHGSLSGEIILEDNMGNSHPVTQRALSSLFSVLKDHIRCVVLNACHSALQAQAIAQHIDCVVGMSDAIGDSAAINFAKAFYRALGFGKDIQKAFDLGCVQIDLANLNEQDTPKLLCNKCKPEHLILVAQPEFG